MPTKWAPTMATVFHVEKMNCTNCGRYLTEAIHARHPQANVKVDLSTKCVDVAPALADPAAVAKAISAAGYPAQVTA